MDETQRISIDDIPLTAQRIAANRQGVFNSTSAAMGRGQDDSGGRALAEILAAQPFPTLQPEDGYLLHLGSEEEGGEYEKHANSDPHNNSPPIAAGAKSSTVPRQHSDTTNNNTNSEHTNKANHTSSTATPESKVLFADADEEDVHRRGGAAPPLPRPPGDAMGVLGEESPMGEEYVVPPRPTLKPQSNTRGADDQDGGDLETILEIVDASHASAQSTPQLMVNPNSPPLYGGGAASSGSGGVDVAVELTPGIGERGASRLDLAQTLNVQDLSLLPDASLGMPSPMKPYGAGRDGSEGCDSQTTTEDYHPHDAEPLAETIDDGCYKPHLNDDVVVAPGHSQGQAADCSQLLVGAAASQVAVNKSGKVESEDAPFLTAACADPEDASRAGGCTAKTSCQPSPPVSTAAAPLSGKRPSHHHHQALPSGKAASTALPPPNPQLTTARKRPAFVAGTRVEGRWGRRWFGAVVTEDEKKGYVQIQWDDDGGLLHVKVREIRLPKGAELPVETTKDEEEKDASGRASTRGAPPPQAVVPMSGTQLVALMDEEDAREGDDNMKEDVGGNLSPLTGRKRSREEDVIIGQEEEGHVAPRMPPPPPSASIHCSSRMASTQGDYMQHMADAAPLPTLDDAAQMIVFVSEEPSEDELIVKINYLRKCGAEVIVGSMLDLLQAVEVNPMRRWVLFLVSLGEKERKKGATESFVHPIVYARALGVTALAFAWLQNVDLDNPLRYADCMRHAVSLSLQTMTPQSDSAPLAFTPRAVADRLLFGKVVLSSSRSLQPNDPMRLLVRAAGGTMVLQRAELKGTQPDYLYVPPGRTARLDPASDVWLSTAPHLTASELAGLIDKHNVEWRLRGEGGEHNDEGKSADTADKKAADGDDDDVSGRLPPISPQHSMAHCIPTQLLGRGSAAEENRYKNSSKSPVVVPPLPYAQRSSLRRVMGHAAAAQSPPPSLSMGGINNDSVFDYPSPLIGVGEDYYFRMPNSTAPTAAGGQLVAPTIAIGRVIAVSESRHNNNNNNNNVDCATPTKKDHHNGSACEAAADASSSIANVFVTLQLYEIKYVMMLQNPHTGELDQQTTVFLGPRRYTVPANSLLFDTPVYVVSSTALRHVYVLESEQQQPQQRGQLVGAGAVANAATAACGTVHETMAVGTYSSVSRPDSPHRGTAPPQQER